MEKTDTLRKKVIQEILESIGVIKRSLMLGSQALHKNGMKPLAPSQWTLLHIVEHQKAMSIKEIAEALKISSSAATQLVSSMVAKKYLTKKESTRDRRGTTVELSKKSKKEIAQFKKEGLKKVSQMFSILTTEELKIYHELNKKIAQNLTNF